MNKSILFLALFFSAFSSQAEISAEDYQKIADYGSRLFASRLVDIYPLVVNDFISESPKKPKLEFADFCWELGKFQGRFDIIVDEWGTGKFEINIGDDQTWAFHRELASWLSKLQSDLIRLSGYCNQGANPKYTVGFQNADAFSKEFLVFIDTVLELSLYLQNDLQGKYRLETAEDIKQYWLGPLSQ